MRVLNMVLDTGFCFTICFGIILVLTALVKSKELGFFLILAVVFLFKEGKLVGVLYANLYCVSGVSCVSGGAYNVCLLALELLDNRCLLALELLDNRCLLALELDFDGIREFKEELNMFF
jgi:hypothetical protein